MKEYIERKAVVMGVLGLTIVDPMVAQYADAVLHQIQQAPAADVVSRAAFDQVMWERDVAIQQLREDYGVGLGEKKAADVVERSSFEAVGQKYAKIQGKLIRGELVERKRGRWEWNGKCWECSNCRCNRFHDLALGLDAAYCGHCGADMKEAPT